LEGEVNMIYENFISNVLLERGINSIHQLNIRDLSEAFNIKIYYWNCGTRLVSEEETYCVIDISKPDIIQYEEFLHELVHYIITHDINTITNLKVWKHIEGKVNCLVPYLAIPKFLLADLNRFTNIYDAGEYFNITPRLLLRRLKSLKGVNYENSIVCSSIYRTAN
jgi:hypothetical protein